MFCSVILYLHWFETVWNGAIYELQWESSDSKRMAVARAETTECDELSQECVQCADKKLLWCWVCVCLHLYIFGKQEKNIDSHTEEEKIRSILIVVEYTCIPSSDIHSKQYENEKNKKKHTHIRRWTSNINEWEETGRNVLHFYWEWRIRIHQHNSLARRNDGSERRVK